MPKTITFAGRQIIEPGAYSEIKNGNTLPPIEADYGTVMIIDDGLGANYGIGSGIEGTIAPKAKAFSTFTELTEFKKAIRGGIYWDIADLLFQPDVDSPGISKLIFVSARTTVAATFTFTFASTGSVTFKARNEGLGGNGAVNGGGYLTKGYGVKLIAGTVDTAKYKMIFYEGQFRGLDSNSVPYNLAEASILENTVICTSPEYLTVLDFITWMTNDPTFNAYFKLTASTSTGNLAAGDLTTYSGIQLLASGTETYNATDLDTVLEYAAEMDNSFFLSGKYGDNAQGTNNTKLLTFINQKAVFGKILFIGGGVDSSKLAQTNGSIPTATYFNTEKAVIVHSGVNLISQTTGLVVERDSFYHAALLLGRLAGLEPQNPLTWKRISRIVGLRHEFTLTQRETALKSGVCHTKYVNGRGWAVNQAITSLVPNDYTVDENANSPEISIVRIKHQLNKELVLNAALRFTGKNINTASAEDIKTFTEGLLRGRTATKLVDNLIISFRNVSVKLVGDRWYTTYYFVPNGPINREFFTGYMIDPNIQI